VPGPAKSLFCPHKRLVSVCPICGSARAGAATPQREAVQHDVDDTWHAFRLQCFARIRGYVTRVRDGEKPEQAYWAEYARVERRGRIASEEEDTTTFRGGFYRAMVKMIDITIDDRRVQGYNAESDWEELRDFVLRKLSPDALDAALRDGRLLLHGGNGAWARQQIASDVLRSDAIQPLVMGLAFGADGVSCADATDAEVARRLADIERVDAKALALATRVLHVFAPARWPALTPATRPEVGEELGFPIPEVASARDYPALAAAVREIAAAKKHPDLDRTDMLIADAAAMLGDE
jgi:hypothetical protein